MGFYITLITVAVAFTAVGLLYSTEAPWRWLEAMCSRRLRKKLGEFDLARVADSAFWAEHGAEGGVADSLGCFPRGEAEALRDAIVATTTGLTAEVYPENPNEPTTPPYYIVRVTFTGLRRGVSLGGLRPSLSDKE
jgi:hypothetical protein